MPTFNILNSQEKIQYSSVPKFTSYDRKKYFKINSEIETCLTVLRKPNTKVAFLLVFGYFKATKQFFSSSFCEADISYLCSKLGLTKGSFEVGSYSRQNFYQHKRLILQLTGWNEFDSRSEEVMKVEIRFLLRSQTRQKQIYERLIDALIASKTEIPSYNILANLIVQETKKYDLRIDEILISSLGKEVIGELNLLLNRDTGGGLSGTKGQIEAEGKSQNQSELASDKISFTTPYILTTLKRFNQSNKPGKIQKNLVALASLKSLFTKLEPADRQIDFTNEGIKYYASLTIKQELFQLARRDQNERLIYFYCFIISQYQKLQDLLVDTIYYTVYSYQNQAKKAMETSYLETKTDNDKFFELVKVSRKKQAASYGTMKKIIQDNSLGAEIKIQQLNLLITEAEKSLPDPELIKTLEVAKNMDENYFLEVQARKIIIRLSSIVQELDFDRDPQSNDQEILQAIDYYKANKGEIGDKAPTGFLSKMDLKAVKVKVKDEIKGNVHIDQETRGNSSVKSEKNEKGSKQPGLRKSLYKVFLFKEISKHLKAGSLNLKHSFRYKSAEESLIGATDFEQNMENYLSLASQTGNKDGGDVLSNIQQKVDFAYNNTNCNILSGRNELIKFDTSKEEDAKPNISSKFTILTPKIEESGTKLSDLLPKDKYIDLTEILHTVANMAGYCQLFENLQNNPSRIKPSKDTILASIFALGCNLGLHKVSQITGIKESELEYANNWYLTLDNLKLANEKVVELITKLDLPNIYKLHSNNQNQYQNSQYQNKLFTSSDGQKVINNKDSFNSNYSYKFGGKTKASSNYTHIDMRHILFHSTVISASEREAVYVIDGLLHSKWIQSDVHATDSFGATEVVFGLCYLLGFELVPRLKEVHSHTLYSFKSRREYEAMRVKIIDTKISNDNKSKDTEKKIDGKIQSLKYKILPKQTIKKELILDEWNNLLRLACSIKLGICSGSQILKRLNSYSKKNKLYLALRELGRIIKTNMILTYIDDSQLRQMIQKQLNIVEHSNRFSKAVRFGNGGEMLKVEKQDQDIAESCKRLQENSIILHNYLYLTRLIQNEPDQTKRKEMLEIISRGSPICWSHINFYGEYNFSEQNNPDSYDLNLSQINAFKLSDFWEGQKPQNASQN
jgi:TnpA family transposase/Arc/MetJ-type ribon-helix-helix transcriptional regulator